PGSSVPLLGELMKRPAFAVDDLTNGSIPKQPGGPALSFTALPPLLGLCLRQLTRGRRLLVLAALFTLPTILATIARVEEPNIKGKHLAFVLIFNVISHALLPLTALVFASGMIQDEIEEQTLTYLVIRPLPKWAIYVAKYLATVIVSVGLMAVFVLITYTAIYW